MRRLLKAIATATIIATIGTGVVSCSYNQSVVMFNHDTRELVKALASPVVVENYEEEQARTEHNNAIATQEQTQTQEQTTYGTITSVYCSECGEFIVVQDNETETDALYNHEIDYHEYQEIR